MQTLVEYTPYQLTFLNGKVRKGALLKFSFSDDGIGFSDCHPWEEFGDAPLQTQLKMLKRGELTPLTKRCTEIAHCDAAARRYGVSLFEGRKVPDSHYLLMELTDPSSLFPPFEEGFKAIKTKNIDLNRIDQIASILSNYRTKLRIDFNERFTYSEFIPVLEVLYPYRKVIDYIEDPFLFHEEKWLTLQERFEIRFAKDHTSSNSPFIQIVKPSRYLPSLNKDYSITVTSYLGHPLGQVQDAYYASVIHKTMNVGLCGLNSHRVYKMNNFSEQLTQIGPKFTVPLGTGLGFNELLEKQPWRPL